MASMVAETRNEHGEGLLARTIENQTAKLPSDVFLWAATGCIAGSLACHIAGRRDDGLLIGQWVPTLLLLGVYNKIVKVSGSDRTHP